MSDWTAFGRVDADGTVYVKTAAGERVVGSWQAGTPEEGLAHFARRFADLVTEVDLMEARLNCGAADAAHSLASDQADARLPGRGARGRRHRRPRGPAGQAGRRRRGEGRRGPGRPGSRPGRGAGPQDRAGGGGREDRRRVDRLEDRRRPASRRSSTSGRPSAGSTRRPTASCGSASPPPGTPSPAAAAPTSPPWTRSASRRRPARRSWSPRPSRWPTPPTGRATADRLKELMAEWKAAPRAAKEAEQRLWERFRAAQDAFFTRRSEVFSARDAEQRANLERKQALLAEAEALDVDADPQAAQAKLREIQAPWHDAGRVPRDAAAALDRRLRAVEDKVRAGDGLRLAADRPVGEPAAGPDARAGRRGRGSGWPGPRPPATPSGSREAEQALDASGSSSARRAPQLTTEAGSQLDRCTEPLRLRRACAGRARPRGRAQCVLAGAASACGDLRLATVDPAPGQLTRSRGRGGPPGRADRRQAERHPGVRVSGRPRRRRRRGYGGGDSGAPSALRWCGAA